MEKIDVNGSNQNFHNNGAKFGEQTTRMQSTLDFPTIGGRCVKMAYCHREEFLDETEVAPQSWTVG